MNILYFDIESHASDFMWDMDRYEFFRLGQYAWDDGEIVLTHDLDELIEQVEAADLIVGHNILGFDLTAIYGKDSMRPLELALDGRVMDTMVLANLVTPAPETYKDRKGHRFFNARKPEQAMKWLSLDNLCYQFGVGGKMGDLKEMAKAVNKEAGRLPSDVRGFGEIPFTDEFLDYARQDIVSVRDLYFVLSRMLDTSMIPEDYVWREMKIVAIDAQNSRNGVLVDQDAAQDRVNELAAERDRIMEVLVREYNFPTEGKSPWASAAGKQAILDILESYGITEETKPDWPRTPKGALKLGGQDLLDLTEGTDAEDVGRALATLKGQRSLAQLALDSTHADGRAHLSITRFQRSGRTSVSKPGITVWSARGEGAVEKRYFIADPGHKFVAFDLSNADARIVAAYSGDQNYAKRFEPGVDAHELTGRLVFGDETYDSDPKNYRQTAKMCIAEGEQVLTDSGLKPIEKVALDDKVWDGVEWVTHEGIVLKGLKDVIFYAGLRATPDHVVFGERDGVVVEVPFGVAARDQLPLVTTGAGGTELRLSDVYQLGAGGDNPEAEGDRLVRRGSMPHLRDEWLGEPGESEGGEVEGLPAVRSLGEVPVPEVAASSTLGREAALHEPQEAAVRELRGTGAGVWVQERSRSRDGIVEQVPGHDNRPGNRPNQQRPGVRTGELADDLAIGKCGEPSEHFDSNVGSTVLAVYPEYRDEEASFWYDSGRDDRGGAFAGEEQGEPTPKSSRKARVYDIINAGELHRFTVSDALVSNCTHSYSYRAGARTIAAQAGVTLATAQRFVNAMEAAYPDVTAWQEDTTDEARLGYVQNDWGRIMPIDKDRAYTQGPALYGQSGTREIICDALIRIAEDDPAVLRWLTFQIHDELIWNIPEDELWWAVDYIKDMMEQYFKPHNGGQSVHFPAANGPAADSWFGATH